jgi:hypothetical protein
MMLYRHSVFVVSAFIALTVGTSWRYFSEPLRQPSPYVHAHAGALTLWLMLLLVQACTSQCRRLDLHRWLGRVSYGVVALVVVTTAALIQHSLHGKVIVDPGLKVVAFNASTLLAFVVLYGAALYHRTDHARHQRYMLATMLPLSVAVSGRLLTAIPSLVNLATLVFGSFVALGQAGLLLADAVALALAGSDWRRTEKPGPFVVAFASLVGIHLSPVVLPTLPVWYAFVQ